CRGGTRLRCGGAGEPAGAGALSLLWRCSLSNDSCGWARRYQAMVQVPAQQIAGVYHRRIGDIVVTALSDGYLDGTVEVMQNIAPDDATRMLSEAFRPGRRTSVNCYLV